MREALARLGQVLRSGFFISITPSTRPPTGGSDIAFSVFPVYCFARSAGTPERAAHRSLVYARDGEDYVVVGSLGGADRAPGWLHNLRARPEVEVQIARDRFAAVGTVVERDDDDYQRLWQVVNENNRGRYDRYQAKTNRPIPIVGLSRR